MILSEQKYINYQDFFDAHGKLYLHGSLVIIEEMYQHFKDRVMDDIDEYKASLHN